MNSLHIILDFIIDLACVIFLVRFLLQASGADFYNPISQSVVKGTDYICKPLRMVLKPIGSFDLASLLVAWLISVLGVVLYGLVFANTLYLSVNTLWIGLIQMLLVLTNFYKFTIIIIVIASFIAPGGYNPVLALLNQLLEPLIGPIRKVIPPLGPLDLSPMIVILVIFLVEDLLRSQF